MSLNIDNTNSLAIDIESLLTDNRSLLQLIDNSEELKYKNSKGFEFISYSRSKEESKKSDKSKEE